MKKHVNEFKSFFRTNFQKKFDFPSTRISLPHYSRFSFEYWIPLICYVWNTYKPQLLGINRSFGKNLLQYSYFLKLILFMQYILHIFRRQVNQKYQKSLWPWRLLVWNCLVFMWIRLIGLISPIARSSIANGMTCRWCWAFLVNKSGWTI